MCGMNLAFDRQLIGPAMYFGLMGEGQPIGRYDDMWAGWCCKVDTLLLLLFVAPFRTPALHICCCCGCICWVVCQGAVLSASLPLACIPLSPAVEGEMVGSTCSVAGIHGVGLCVAFLLLQPLASTGR